MPQMGQTWKARQENGGEYGESLTLGDGVDDTTGKLFWVKAKATEDEVPHNDLTVTLRASGSHGRANNRETDCYF